MILMYLHDLTLCFLAMINMILSVYNMYFLFQVEICQYVKYHVLDVDLCLFASIFHLVALVARFLPFK